MSARAPTPGRVLAEAEVWEARYAAGRDLFGSAPNRFLVEQLEGLAPARVLLPGEGEGRNARGLLAAGHEVCAVDLSATARDRAVAAAGAHAGRLHYRVADVTAVPGDGAFAAPFDVVALGFVHLPPGQRRAAHRALAARLAPGGRVLVQSFAPAQAARSGMGPNTPARLCSPAVLAKDFPGLEVLRARELETELEEGPLHTGPARVVEFVARRN
jgi:SAM-dependent methyltransferase